MEENNRLQHQDIPGILHTGDLVLIKSQVLVDDLHAEAGQRDNDTGFICVDGIRALLTMLRTDRIEGTGLDIREFLFMVVGQLGYARQNYAKKRLKQIEEQGEELQGNALSSFHLVEQRAQREQEENETMYMSGPTPVYYGDVIQLMHVRTGRYVSLNKNRPGLLDSSSRLVELQPGSAKSWIRLLPFYAHQLPGQPVVLGEQMIISISKIGWNLNWHRGQTAAENPAFEVNCVERGRGFYFILYSRNIMSRAHSMDTAAKPALNFGLAISLALPHNSGFVTASCSAQKREPYLRYADRGFSQRSLQGEVCAKSIWIIEHVGKSTDQGISYLQTPVQLRHYGSGRYLSISVSELKSKHTSGRDEHAEDAAEKASRPHRNRPANCTCRASLADLPGPGCVFVLEPTDSTGAGESGVRPLIHRNDDTPILLRWDNPFASWSLWLSCNGMKKGRRKSLQLIWSETRLPRDAIVMKVISDTPWMFECDVVTEHASILRRFITPRCHEFDKPRIAAEIGGRLERMLTDMIYFLSGSPLWRAHDVPEFDAPDVLLVPDTAVPHRQRLIRELKYIDASVELFHALVKMTPTLKQGSFAWKERAAMHTKNCKKPPKQTEHLALEGIRHDEHEDTVDLLKTHCLKLLLRLWMYCFLYYDENARYFHKNGWLATIDRMNGHGLGASTVFVALLNNNPNLVRTLDRSIMHKFINFIRTLGPLDVWLSFLNAVCAPSQKAMFQNQQAILSTLFFPGQRCPPGESWTTEQNRKDLMISFRLHRPVGCKVGPPSRHPHVQAKRLEDCLGKSVLKHGVYEIAISWTAPDYWSVGDDVLYHSPSHLGLKVYDLPGEAYGMSQASWREANREGWVYLPSLVWVLQPEDCCLAATGVRWEEMQSDPAMFGGSSVAIRKTGIMSRHSVRHGHAIQRQTPSSGESRFGQLLMLAKYLLAQLRLVADLVKQRQTNCMLTLQEEYSFELCISGASDARLPCAIRAAFLNILVDLWVDRYPHHQVFVPSLMRHPDHYSADADVEQLPAFMLYREEAPDNWSEQHLSRLSDEVVLFYALRTPYKMEAALRLLRQYFFAGPPTQQMVYSEPGKTKLTNAMFRLLLSLFKFGFVFSSSLLQEIQGPILRCLDGRTDALFPMLNERTQKNRLTIRQDQQVVMSSSQEGDDSLMNREFTMAWWPPYDTPSDRYAATGEGVTNAKVYMLQAILHSMNAGMHIQISRCVTRCSDAFTNPDENATPENVAYYAAQLVETLDSPFIKLRTYGISMPNVMLLDLMMYEDPVIFKLALQVLVQNCMQTTTLTDTLKNVILLAPSQLQLFETLKAEVCTLGQLLNSFENWAVEDYFSPLDRGKFQLFQRICLKIRNLCDLGDASSSPSEVQYMLSETELFVHIRSVMRFDPRDYIPSCQDLLGKIVALMCSVASKFVAGNAINQNMMHQELPCIVNLMSTHADAAILLASIFKGNLTLCEQVPAKLVNEVGNLIVRERRRGKWAPWYLSFYTTITSVDDSAVRRNQVLIVDTLQALTPMSALHLLQEPRWQAHLMVLIARFRSHKELQCAEVTSYVDGEDAELLYYIRCLDLLVALCVGPTHENLMSKAFVSHCFSRVGAVQLITSTYEDGIQHEDGVPKGSKSVRLHVATRWFRLLHRTLYDVDGTLMDIQFLMSAEHTAFLRLMLEWLKDFLGGDLAVPSKTSLIEEQEEECLREILNCVGSFFSNVYAEIVEAVKDPDFAPVVQGYSSFFRPLMSATTSFTSCVRDANSQLLIVTAYRIVDSTEVRPQFSDFALKEMSRIMKKQEKAVSMNPAHLYWHQVRLRLMADPQIQHKVEAEQREFGRVVFGVGEYTDPERAEYVNHIPKSSDMGLPGDVDFRRNCITMEQVLTRIVKFSKDFLLEDFESIRRVQSLIQAVLNWARNSNIMVLKECHKSFVNAGVTDLIIAILDATTPEDIDACAWHLLAEVLQGQHAEGSTVAKDVQEAILNTCLNGDDSGMWVTFEEFLRSVTVKVKSVKWMKLQVNRTPTEINLLKEYDMCLHHAVMAMEAVRLTVEGHYFPMQQYLFAQVGNHRSCNVLESAANLLARLCKDHGAADTLFHTEMHCMAAALALLIEVSQGPNMRNQEFLSTVGLIETIFNIVGSNFASQQARHGDVYPPEVRLLKAQCMQTMQSLLEGRSDSKIHEVMLHRCDTFVLRERMNFLYIYYVLGSVGVSSERIKSEMHAAMPIHDRLAPLTDASADPTIVYNELIPSIPTAEELLEDMDEAELDELFAEGLNVLVLLIQLSRKSPSFEEAVMPVPIEQDPFQNTASKYLSQREYQLELTAFHRREIYRYAFGFVSRFVKTIEVILNGQLQQLHFPRPLTEMWYVFGLAKSKIESAVPLGAKQAKMKTFILMCQKSHSESKLIRKLSRFSVFPDQYVRWAQRHLWDSAHRPFQTFLKDDAAKIGQLLRLQLILSVTLTMYTGLYLVPAKDPSAVGNSWSCNDGLAWSSQTTFIIAESMGGLYFISIALWLFLTASVKLPLNYEAAQLKYPRRSCLRWLPYSLFTTMTDRAIASRFALLICSGAALFVKEFWLYSVLLCDLLYQNSTLADVCKCIFSKVLPLSMSFLGAGIVTYVYAAIGFWTFRGDFGNFCDVDIHICVQNILYQGTRNSIIGLSNMLKLVNNDSPQWSGRWAFDVSYFVVFGVMLLNTIVAQIVDSFYELRGETEARDKMMETQTFISCIDREIIESIAQSKGLSDGFEYHETQKQNRWDYMSFIYHLREKDAGDYTGPEQKIRQQIEIGDIGWMPIGRSLMVDEQGAQENKDDHRERIGEAILGLAAKLEGAKEHRAVQQQQMISLETQFEDRVTAVEAELRQLVENLTKARHCARASIIAGID